MILDNLSFIPLGGIGNVTKNMYVYEYNNQILLVDCGIGFADETMLGVDLLLPDISYLLQAVKSGKKIVGMLLSHGHEDHMGGLPFILPQLPEFPVFATPFSASLANKKLQEFGDGKKVQAIDFGERQEVKLGAFSAYFIRVTHSVPDTSHIFIKTPIGNFYHGSDYKFDNQPFDGQVSDLDGIKKAGDQGIVALMTDCLGSERPGTTPSEKGMENHFLEVMQRATGKVVITTYSSHINRLSQIIWAAEKAGRRICFVGRSLIHAVDVAKIAKRIQMPKGMEAQIDDLKFIKPSNLVLIVAGSQGQENSAMTRMVAGIHKDVSLLRQDVVIFSSDTIPGNEVLVNGVIDEISRQEIPVFYSEITHDFHVSGHASQEEMKKLLSLTHPKYVVPISGNYRHMAAYKRLAKKNGYDDGHVLLAENGQEYIFMSNSLRLGKKYPSKTIYLDQISGEEVEDYVLLDREKLSTEGVVIVMAEVDEETGKLFQDPDIIARGFSATDTNAVRKIVGKSVRNAFQRNPKQLKNTPFVRKLIRDVAEREISQKLKRKPLILPVVIEI